MVTTRLKFVTYFFCFGYLPNMLQSQNPHPRDERIRFVEESHKYYVDGSVDGFEYISTTSLMHSMFKPFDADEVIDKMRKSRNWANSPYHGQSPEEIKAGWDSNRDLAAKSGTAMHENIENFYNGIDHKITPEFEMFQKFRDDHEGLVPYRTEWCIFDEDSKVSGSVDMVYEVSESPGTFGIADWKRSKAIKTENKWQSGTSKHTSHLPDCNFIHYSLQLSTYKYILEKNYGLTISDTFIVVLHPAQDSYNKIVTRDLSAEVEGIMAESRTPDQL